MKKFKNITIGSDIELFLVDKNGKNITAEGIIPGTKYEPLPISNLRTLSVDCVAAEFTINPVTTGKAFKEEINFMKDYISKFVAPNELFLDIFPARVFEDDQLVTDTSRLAGCEVDYCVRTKEINEKPQMENSGLRSCGKNVCHFTK